MFKTLFQLVFGKKESSKGSTKQTELPVAPYKVETPVEVVSSPDQTTLKDIINDDLKKDQDIVKSETKTRKPRAKKAKSESSDTKKPSKLKVVK